MAASAGGVRKRVKQWTKKSSLSKASVRVVDDLITNPACIPTKANVVMTMALFQRTLGPEHGGLLQDVVGLLHVIAEHAGVVRRLLFVGSGLGHGEHALAELLKRVAKTDPVKFAGLQHMTAVYTDGGIGDDAPPVSVWSDSVLKMMASDAIREYGDDQSVVLVINPNASHDLGLADSASRAGVPLVLSFMERPSNGLNAVELDAAVQAYRGPDDGKPLRPAESLAVMSLIASDDGQPLSNMTRGDWHCLNRTYELCTVLPACDQFMPVVQCAKPMAWHAFSYRGLPMLSGGLEKSTPRRPGEMLLKRTGKHLESLVIRYAHVVKRTNRSVGSDRGPGPAEKP